MDRRSFFGAFGGLLGLGTTVHATTPTEEPVRTTPGPYSVEVREPSVLIQTELPLFDCLKQAKSYASARANIMRNSGDGTGKVVVLNKDRTVVQYTIWDKYSSSTISYF